MVFPLSGPLEGSRVFSAAFYFAIVLTYSSVGVIGYAEIGSVIVSICEKVYAVVALLAAVGHYLSYRHRISRRCIISDQYKTMLELTISGLVEFATSSFLKGIDFALSKQWITLISEAVVLLFPGLIVRSFVNMIAQVSLITVVLYVVKVMITNLMEDATGKDIDNDGQ